VNKVLIIVGPTASGKTALSIKIAERFSGEIISADSRQVYTGLNIGTGKVTLDEMAGIPHYLLNVANPKDMFTAHDFKEAALRAITIVHEHENLPIVVGGTGFYIDVLTDRITPHPVAFDPTLRTQLETKATNELCDELAKTAPGVAERLHAKNESNNRHRIMRALEISQGIPREKTTTHTPTDYLWIGLQLEPDELRESIVSRIYARLEIGMIEEVEELHAAGLSWERLDSLGLEYRYISQFLQGFISREQLITLLEQKIWQYAKRQITYWKRNKNIQWFRPDEYEKISAVVEKWVKE